MKLFLYFAVFSGLAFLADTTYPQDAVSAGADTSSGQGQTVLNLIDNQYVHVDLKAISADKGSFGVDYKVELAKTLIKEENEMGRKWDLSLLGTGFLTAKPEKNDINSLITEAAFKANPLWRVAPKGGEKIPREIVEDPNPESLQRWMKEHGGSYISPLSVYGKTNVKYETTEDGRVYDFALGGALGITTGYLNSILDIPFSALRLPSKAHPESNNGPRQIDVSIGYDFVTGRHADNSAKTPRDESDANRIVLKAEWETGILRGDRIVLSFNGHQQISGPTATDGMHPFFLARFEHILFEQVNAKTSFAINYTAGELPPEFKAGHVIGAGFSIEWE